MSMEDQTKRQHGRKREREGDRGLPRRELQKGVWIIQMVRRSGALLRNANVGWTRHATQSSSRTHSPGFTLEHPGDP